MSTQLMTKTTVTGSNSSNITKTGLFNRLRHYHRISTGQATRGRTVIMRRLVRRPRNFKIFGLSNVISKRVFRVNNSTTITGTFNSKITLSTSLTNFSMTMRATTRQINRGTTRIEIFLLRMWNHSNMNTPNTHNNCPNVGNTFNLNPGFKTNNFMINLTINRIIRLINPSNVVRFFHRAAQ